MSDITLSTNEEQREVELQTPTQPVSILFLVFLSLASFVMWMGLIPLTQTIIPLHVSTLYSNAARYSPTSLLQAFGGLSAIIVYPLVGALSDRTYTRFGRRKPWIVGGAIGAAIMLVVIANSYAFLPLAISWVVFCFCATAAQSSIFTLLPDKVPVNQRARASALLGLMAPLGIVAGTILAGTLGRGAFRLTYYVIAVLEVGGVLLFASQLHEDKPNHESPPFHFWRFVASFWIDPRRYPDFARVWWARILFILGYATLQNYLLFFLQDSGLFPGRQATFAVANFQVISTVALLLGSFSTAYLSDRWMRRKPFAITAGIFVTGALLLVAFFPNVVLVYTSAFFFGLGFGIYASTEVALGTQVLTSNKSHGKDMGVLSLGGNIPQTIAPLYASTVITATHNYTLLFGLASIPPILSSLLVMGIKRAK